MPKRLTGDDKVITPYVLRYLEANPDWRLEPQYADLVVRLLSEEYQSRVRRFGGSSANSCERAQLFGYIGVPGEQINDDMLSMVFTDGKYRHVRWQILLLQSGAVTDVEYQLYNEVLRVGGKADAIGEDFGVEIKGTRNIEPAWADARWQHKMQSHRYMLASNGRFRRWVYIYEDKATQEWVEHVTYWEDEVGEEVLGELIRLNEARKTKALPVVKPRCEQRRGLEYEECAYHQWCNGITGWGQALRFAKTGRITLAKPERRRLPRNPNIPPE